MISNAQADVLAHTSRNGRYVTDEESVIQMGRDGHLRDHGPQRLADGMHYLTLTEKGREALAEWRDSQPKPKPVSKAKQRAHARYMAFLRARDALGCTFREFLTHPYFKSAR